jgi:hypothetical protein
MAGEGVRNVFGTGTGQDGRMKARTFGRHGWVLSVSIAMILAAGFLLPFREDSLFFLLIAVPFLVVGALVVNRRPGNPVGWLFLGFAGVAAFAFAALSYWASGPDGPGSRPGADLAASLAVHLWHPGFSFFILGFLLFPEGRLLSRRWLIPALITVVAGVIGVLSGMFEHDFEREFVGGSFHPAPLVTGTLADISAVVFSICLFTLLGMLGMSAVSIFLRFRRSTSTLRQQMKWVVSAVVVFAVALPASLFMLGEAYGAYALPLIPISAGIAILRYRLFDIDVIINRTLVYSALSVLLALVYGIGVFGVGGVLRSVTGQEGNNLAVAASTLGVAALFRPARGRIQAFIDRRFYRRRYDAARTIESFGSRLRHETDLYSLRDELLQLIEETMQPAHASLWLKEPEERHQMTRPSASN